MNINRQNYESYFLLYTDNELSVAEKKEVDEFVQINPDLQKELVMLQQSILQPEQIVFGDKINLIKREFIPIRLQEKLLLYLDNELTTTERNEMEASIAGDAEIKKEWLLLKETKFRDGGAMVFADKKSLYRKEEGRLVAFPWRKILVAAVFIGFGVWGGLVYLNNNRNVGDGKIVAYAKTATTPVTEKVPTHQPTQPIARVGSSAVINKTIMVNRVIPKRASTGSTQQTGTKVVPRTLAERDIETIAITEKDNNLPKPYFDNVNSVGGNKTITAHVTTEKQVNALVNPGDNDIAKSSKQQDPANQYASTTSYANNSEDNNNNNNHVLFMNEATIKKTKLGGIFRKVKRVLERNTNIKAGGNNIKVANLEFAIQ